MPEQIIKLWKDVGFEVRTCFKLPSNKKRFEAHKQWVEEVNHFKFHTSAEIIINEEYLHINGNFPNEYRQLLIKTLMALDKVGIYTEDGIKAFGD